MTKPTNKAAYCETVGVKVLVVEHPIGLHIKVVQDDILWHSGVGGAGSSARQGGCLKVWCLDSQSALQSPSPYSCIDYGQWTLEGQWTFNEWDSGPSMDIGCKMDSGPSVHILCIVQSAQA